MTPTEDAEDISAKAMTPTLLQGFVVSERRTAIQENVYIILNHGKFQRQVLFCAIFSLIVVLLHTFAYRIIGRRVDHWCQPPAEFRDMLVQDWKNIAIPVLADGSLSQCTVYDPAIPDGSEEQRLEVPCERWDYDIGHKGDSIVSNWDLVCHRSWLYSISPPIYMLASTLFVPLAGIVSDRVGRKPAIMASAIGMLFATLGAGSSHSFSLFLLARFVISATSSATNLLVFIMLYEVTGNERRALYGLLATCIGPTVTPSMLHMLALFQPSWKVSQTFLATATAFVVAWCYCLEESPVWLLATWKLRQAELVMLQAARYNGVDLEKARFTFKALKKQLEKLETTATTISTARESMLHGSTFRRRAISVLVSWFGVSFAYYGTALRQSQMKEQWEVSGFLLKTALFATVYDSMTRRGQRATLSGVLALLCASSALQTAVVEWDIAHAIPLSTIVVEGASAAAMGVNYSYTTEVFATTIRSMGLCVSYSVGRVGVLLASFLVYIARGRPSSWFYLATTFVVYVSAMAIQCLPEILIDQTITPAPDAMARRSSKDVLKKSLNEWRTAKSQSSPSTSSGRAGSKTSSPHTELATQPSTTVTPSFQSCPRQLSTASPTPVIMARRGSKQALKMYWDGGKGTKLRSPNASSGRAESKSSSPSTEFATQPAPTVTPSFESCPPPTTPSPQVRAASTPRKSSKHRKSRQYAETPRSA